MPFCSHCGKELSEGVTFCPNCGERLKTEGKRETHGRKKRRIVWFFIGLIVVGAICGVLFPIEDASTPFELRVQMGVVEQLRKDPYELQLAIARLKGITVEELLASPYDPWAPKVSIGLLSAYGFAWVIYLVYSFFRFVDRPAPVQTASRQLISSADTYNRRDDAHDERGEYGKAIIDYNKAIELNPNDADAYYRRGDAYYQMGEHTKAMSDYNTAITLNKNHALAYYKRGLAYRNSGKVSWSVSDLEKCIALSTDAELTEDAQRELSEIRQSP